MVDDKNQRSAKKTRPRGCTASYLNAYASNPPLIKGGMRVPPFVKGG